MRTTWQDNIVWQHGRCFSQAVKEEFLRRGNMSVSKGCEGKVHENIWYVTFQMQVAKKTLICNTRPIIKVEEGPNKCSGGEVFSRAYHWACQKEKKNIFIDMIFNRLWVMRIAFKRMQCSKNLHIHIRFMMWYFLCNPAHLSYVCNFILEIHKIRKWWVVKSPRCVWKVLTEENSLKVSSVVPWEGWSKILRSGVFFSLSRHFIYHFLISWFTLLQIYALI